VDERWSTAEFDALAIVVPGFAAFRADVGVAAKRAVAIGFDNDAGLIAVRNANRERAVHGMRLQTGTVPGLSTERYVDRAVLRANFHVAARSERGNGAILASSFTSPLQSRALIGPLTARAVILPSTE